jgi:hypothetical protein
MYRSDFILGFCSLVHHAPHKAEAGYKNNHRIMMVLNPYPNKTIQHVKTVPDGMTYLVLVCFNISVGGVLHLAILCYHIKRRTMSTFDGLNFNLTNWQKYTIHTIKTYGFEPVDSLVQIEY